jgi:hypothetical protein
MSPHRNNSSLNKQNICFIIDNSKFCSTHKTCATTAYDQFDYEPQVQVHYSIPGYYLKKIVINWVLIFFVSSPWLVLRMPFVGSIREILKINNTKRWVLETLFQGIVHRHGS